MARVLVIDDNKELRELLKRWLEGAGYEVQEAFNGAEGLRLYRENPADLVVADIIMPEKEGIETMVELRKDYPDVKLIAISGGGFEKPDSYLEGAKLIGGALRTFAKPFKREDFLKAVKEIIGQ